MIATGNAADAIIEAGGYRMVSDRDAIAVAVEAALAANPKAIEDLKGGKKKPEAVKGFLRGQVMKQTGGKADPALVGELLAVRKNLGLQMPGPQQRAMIVALDDDDHVAEQHARYASRRAVLREALESAGFRIDHSEASLYLWATRGQDCWTTVSDLAERGILVAPGEFYGPSGREHVRVAFTATDERVAAAASRW
jgi:hypothetical protein